MSDPKPTDFPIARGVAPPPRSFQRVPITLPPKIAAETVVGNQFAFRSVDQQVVVRPPKASNRWPIIAAQSGAVVLLAGICMAAGWWIMHHNDQLTQATPVAVPILVKAAPAKPAVVVKPAEIPVVAQKPAEPPPMPVVKPSEPPPAPPPPTKPMNRPTTTLTFQKDILPILQARCVLCHGDKNKFKGGLDVRTVRSLEKGGETGPAINRQNPEASPLWDSVSTGQMPPGKNKLSDSEKKKLHDWLVGGGK